MAFPLKQFSQFNFLGGENRKLSDFLIDPNQASESLNCNTTKAGAGCKRKGYTKYNTTTFGTGAIYGHYRFYKAGAPICALSKCGTNLYKDNSATPIYSTLTANKWMSFIANNDLCLMSDTVKALKYDGANVRKWGLTAPSTKVTTAEGAAGGLTGDYYYKVTFITAISESSASPVSDKRTVTAKQINLSAIPTCSETDVVCTGRKIYRMGGTTATYNLVTTLENNTTTTYVDNILDADLGVELEKYHDAPFAHAYNIVYKDRVFYAKENSSTIYFSQLDESEYFAGDVPTEGFIDVPGQDIITGFALQFGYLLIFKTNSIWRLFGDSPTNFQIDNAHPVIGCVAPRSIANEANDVYFLSADGIYAFEGQRLKLISEKEEPLINAIPSTYRVNACGGFYSNQYWFSYTSSTGTYNDRVLMYDPRYPDKTGVGPWYHWEGLNINCFCVWNGEGDDGILRTGSSKEGFIHKQDTGYNDNGADIEWSWTTMNFIFGYPELDKRFRKLYINCLIESNLTANWDIDRGAQRGLITITPTVDSDAAYWDVSKWDEGKWADEDKETTAKKNAPQKALGKMIQIKFKETSQKAVEFSGFILFYRIKRLK